MPSGLGMPLEAPMRPLTALTIMSLLLFVVTGVDAADRLVVAIDNGAHC